MTMLIEYIAYITLYIIILISLKYIQIVILTNLFIINLCSTKFISTSKK